MVINMTFQIPLGVYGVVYALILSREHLREHLGVLQLLAELLKGSNFGKDQTLLRCSDLKVI